jgi:malic enzyme
VLHPAPAFCRSLNFNYSPSVASVCEQFTHASELKKEKKKEKGVVSGPARTAGDSKKR